MQTYNTWVTCLLNSNISSTCSHNMVNFGLLTLRSVREFGHPSKFQPVVRFGFAILNWRRATEVNQTLHDVWPSPRLVHYIYILVALAPSRNSARCKIHFAPNLAFSYIGMIIAWHSSSGFSLSSATCNIKYTSPRIHLIGYGFYSYQ